MSKLTKRVKILFFIETLEGGGAEKVLRDLVNSMDKACFDITVQTVWACDAGKYLDDGIRYRSVYPSRSRCNQLRYRIEAALGLTYPLHIRDDYDIECAYLECGATKLLAGSTNLHAKKLAWVHCDLSMVMSDPAGFAERTRRYYRRFDRVVCVSENVREAFTSLYGDLVPADVLYNTVDDGAIRDGASRPLPEGISVPGRLVVSLGRLVEQKNYMRLLRVHKRLIDEGIEHHIWILGEGPQRELLQTYIDENGLGNTALLMGFRDNPFPFLREAELLVCSSECEGFSTFITEGLILGRPIVTTDCTGMRELLGDSDYGLITERSEDGLYEGMKKMLVDPALREHYRQMSCARGKQFSRQALVDRTQTYLLDLTKQNKE